MLSASERLERMLKGVRPSHINRRGDANRCVLLVRLVCQVSVEHLQHFPAVNAVQNSNGRVLLCVSL